MQYLFLESSKYIIAILLMIYAISSISIFGAKKTGGKTAIAVIQNSVNILTVLVCCIHMMLISKNPMYLAVLIFILVSVFLFLFVTQSAFPECNILLLNNFSMLVSCGLLIVSRISINKSFKQFIIVTVSFALCIGMIFIFGKIKFLKKLTWCYAAIGLLLLSVVLVLGKISHGSKLSISLGPVSVQPSEFVKLIFIFFLASILWNELNFKKIIVSALIAALYVGILVVSKDLGSALIYFVIYLFVLVIATGNYIYMFAGLIAGAGASIIAYKIFSHVRVRVMIWQDPWPYIDNKGYQIIQSMFSITSGGFFGTGLLEGTPTTIPFADTDFVFSVICEELGILAGISILIISISTFIEMLRVSSKINDNFYKQIVYGIAVSLLFQAFLTVGGGIKFIPLTGVTLPLISYGGSSIMASTIMYFIVQSIYIRLRREDKVNLSNKKTKH